MGVREDEAILGEDDARADHGAAVAIAREHRDGGGIDFLVNFLDRQRLAVALVVAELDLIGVGQALDGRFAMLTVIVIILVMVLLEIIVVIGPVVSNAPPSHSAVTTPLTRRRPSMQKRKILSLSAFCEVMYASSAVRAAVSAARSAPQWA